MAMYVEVYIQGRPYNAILSTVKPISSIPSRVWDELGKPNPVINTKNVCMVQLHLQIPPCEPYRANFLVHNQQEDIVIGSSDAQMVGMKLDFSRGVATVNSCFNSETKQFGSNEPVRCEVYQPSSSYSRPYHKQDTDKLYSSSRNYGRESINVHPFMDALPDEKQINKHDNNLEGSSSRSPFQPSEEKGKSGVEKCNNSSASISVEIPANKPDASSGENDHDFTRDSRKRSGEYKNTDFTKLTRTIINPNAGRERENNHKHVSENDVDKMNQKEHEALKVERTLENKNADSTKITNPVRTSEVTSEGGRKRKQFCNNSLVELNQEVVLRENSPLPNHSATWSHGRFLKNTDNSGQSKRSTQYHKKAEIKQELQPCNTLANYTIPKRTTVALSNKKNNYSAENEKPDNLGYYSSWDDDPQIELS